MRKVNYVKKNRRVQSIFLAATFLLLFGCEQETYLFVNEAPISFEEAGGSQAIDIIANKEWKVTTDGGWCKVSPSTGLGSENNIRITIQCEPNTSYDERSCNLTVICADARKTVSITQSPKGAIVIDKIDYELSYEAQTLIVSILENTEYQVQVNGDCQDWIQFAGTKGLVTSSFELLISENEKREREGTVYVTSSSDVIALKIKQTDGTINDNIPDPIFRQYCIENFDINNDGLLSFKEAKNVSSIYINPEIISSLDGIAYFSALRYLDCGLVYDSASGAENGPWRFYREGKEVISQLKSLNVSHNNQLEYINCQANQLTELDVSKNPLLENINCSFNQLETLDLENNIELRSLRCYHNGLRSINNTNNSKLGIFDCHDNPLLSLDVSQCKELYFLWVDSEYITNLDLSQNEKLSELLLYCDNLMSLDLSNNKALTRLDCRCKITGLDLSSNTEITSLCCICPQLKTLNVSKNTSLTFLECDYSQMTTLDVSKNTALTSLYCHDNQLAMLDVSKNAALTKMNCQGNQLTALDVSNNAALAELDCGYNQLMTLDVSNNTVLTKLYCQGNQLTALDVSKNTALTSLYCYNETMSDLYLPVGQTIEYYYWYWGTTVHYK